MRICTVVGARPQFVKAAVVSRALAEAGVEELLVHTGQHYDTNMDRVFFEELDIPTPSINLGVGSSTHAEQTGAAMVGLERFLLELDRMPDWVLAYGDTNSTLAAALVAAKLHVPFAHVEAGLRSFNRVMPEEINRVVTDTLSQLLFCPTQTAIDNLRAEGITEGVRLTGDVMLDATRYYAAHAATQRSLQDRTGQQPDGYFLATVHRAENTDDPVRLAGILQGLGRLDWPVLLPLHPRTRARLTGRQLPPNVQVLEPVSYLTMLMLVQHARGVLTDSGGLQKEAYWLGRPCITLREETEWVETLSGGWNRLAGSSPDAIAELARLQPDGPRQPFGEGPGGSPTETIVKALFET